MNTNIFKHICTVVLLLTLCISCAEDMETDTDGKAGLWLKPQLASADATRAVGDKVPGVEALNENKLVSLDVFIGNGGDFTTYHKRFSSALTTTEGSIQIAGSDWKTLFPNTGYDIYIVANSTNDNLSNVTSLSTLQTQTQTDNDIFQPYTAGNAVEKKFLMDGKYTGWTPSENKSDVITVELNRVAAKIQASIELDNSLQEKYTVGNVTWKLKNCETTATVLTESDNPTVGTDDSGNTPLEAYDGKNIITYSYPVKWSDNDDAPYLLINIPLTSKTDGVTKAQNWYRIPVRNTNDSKKQLDRNHIYYVKAIIASEGSSTEETEEQNVLLNYKVYDWTTDDIDVNATSVDYLIVSPTLVYMRNIDTDNSVNYYASGDIEIVSKEVYYYDESGNKQTYTDANLVTLTPVPTATGSTNGKITVSSPIPDEEHAGAGTESNLTAGKFTIRFIRYRVQLKSDPTKYQDVLVKQYPLEYIQNISGWYSTRTTDGWIDWIEDQEEHDTKKKYEDFKEYGQYYDEEDRKKYWSYFGSYNAKIYDSQNNKIFALEDRSSGSGYKAGSYEDSSIGGNNNHMYVIQITRTGTNYMVSRPTMNIDGSSNDHVVSPAFMLASQLGAVNLSKNQTSHGKYAIEHCNTYKEVAKDADGNITEYEGWRLPTKEEISVIAKYQKENSGAPIAEVLGGAYYWAADGTAVATGKTGSSSLVYTRCVRDLSPEEVKKLDENKK